MARKRSTKAVKRDKKVKDLAVKDRGKRVKGGSSNGIDALISVAQQKVNDANTSETPPPAQHWYKPF
jgi:hypothetical protein